LFLGLQRSIRYVGMRRQINTSLMRSPALLGHHPQRQITPRQQREKAAQSGAVKAAREPREHG